MFTLIAIGASLVDPFLGGSSTAGFRDRRGSLVLASALKP